MDAADTVSIARYNSVLPQLLNLVCVAFYSGSFIHVEYVVIEYRL